MICRTIFASACILSLAPALALGQIAAMDIEITNDWWVNVLIETGTGNDGTKFTPIVDIQVTDLGFYDHDQDGLQAVHILNLYDFDTRQSLASVDVGPTSDLNGKFRYEPIAPLTLSAGVPYMVSSWSAGGFEDTAIEFFSKSRVEVADEIVVDRYYFEQVSEVTFPTDGRLTERLYFGPNFLYRTGTGNITRYDFNNDGQANCFDIDSLATAVANNKPSVEFDVNGDFQVDLSDIEDWLQGVGRELSGSPLVNGDANLDSTVDANDLAIWESNRFRGGTWCGGDFSADGLIDGTDFNIWNTAYQATAASSVPEPNLSILLLVILSWTINRSRRVSHS